MNEALGRLITLAGLTVLVGIGVLAWQVGETWTSADTQSVITAMAMVCGGGAVLFALLAALIVGVPLAIRYFGEAGRARQSWGEMQSPPAIGRRLPQIDGYTAGPPLLTAHRDDAGTWQSGGMGNYDMWDEDPTWDEPPAATPGSNRRGRLI